MIKTTSFTKSTSGWRLLIILMALSSLTWTAHAQGETERDPRDRYRQEFEAATADLKSGMISGPAEIPLVDQAVLALPERYAFVPAEQSRRFMNALGNRVGEGFLGLILPRNEKEGWIVVATFEKSGYIRDDDAKSWDIDGLLTALTESTELINRARAERGLGELEVVGWAERPFYDEATHRLVWSLAVRGKGDFTDVPQSVNYNTYALGREGYISLNLVTALDELDRRKAVAQDLLASLSFREGKRYEDFDASVDHVAEYGLAALIGGMAAKKLGLFALAAAFLAKFGKLAAVFALGLFGLFGKRFGWRKADGKGTLEA